MSQRTITIFGAESVGKTTLSRQLAKQLGAHWRCEFARPYLESTGQGVTRRSMRAIWRGQRALQQSAKQTRYDTVMQDTDLFSTVGYWQLPHVSARIGACPTALTTDAISLQSDLYIVLKSNIPFEQDILRYGGTTSESSDDYWLNICKKYELPYIVIESSDHNERIAEALNAIAAMQKRSVLCEV